MTGAKGGAGGGEAESKKEKKGSPLIFSSLLLFFLTPPTPPALLTPATQAAQIMIIRSVKVKPFDISLPQNDVKKKHDRKVSQQSAISLKYD